METETIAFRIPGELKKELDDSADAYGVKKTELITLGLKMILGISPEIYKMIEGLSVRENIQVGTIVNNLLIDVMAKESAITKLNGPHTPSFSAAFIWEEKDQIITGKALFDMLEAKYFTEEEQTKLNHLLDRESHNFTLTPAQKKFLLDHRSGKAWLESEEYKAWKKAPKLDVEMRWGKGDGKD